MVCLRGLLFVEERAEEVVEEGSLDLLSCAKKAGVPDSMFVFQWRRRRRYATTMGMGMSRGGWGKIGPVVSGETTTMQQWSGKRWLGGLLEEEEEEEEASNTRCADAIKCAAWGGRVQSSSEVGEVA